MNTHKYKRMGDTLTFSCGRITGDDDIALLCISVIMRFVNVNDTSRARLDCRDVCVDEGV